MSFANCGLPYFIGNIVNERKDVLPITPDVFKEKKDITVKTYHEVIAINDKDQTVTVVNRQTNEKFKASYDKLILSPGAGANSLGFDSDYIFTLRNMEDTDAIDQFIDQHQAKKALVVGAGYISLEVFLNS